MARADVHAIPTSRDVDGDAAPSVWCDAGRRRLFLPPSSEAWDVELTVDGARVVCCVAPGLYAFDDPPPRRVRPLRTTAWTSPPPPPENIDDDASAKPLAAPAAPDRRPACRPQTPDGVFVEGEPITLLCHPPQGGLHEVSLRADDPAERRSVVTGAGRVVFKRGLPVGGYTVRTRWLDWSAGLDAATWTRWSRPHRVTVDRVTEQPRVDAERIAQHRLELMVSHDLDGVPVVTDPWALPPHCPHGPDVKWFRTPCYDGAGMLVNEAEAYYRDPMQYYLDCIAVLQERGFVFRTWHELLDDPAPRGPREIVLQFDVDAGPGSMTRLLAALAPLDVRGSIMIHRVCHDWYSYAIDDLDRQPLRDAEAGGWTIGYHNNALGNAQRLEHAGDYGPEMLARASAAIVQDVQHLRQWFDIRTLTHHGGNVLNRRTTIPPEAEIVGVDKYEGHELWSTIDRSFSDGGFLSRPRPFCERVREFGDGRHFVRNHPVKYANYEPPFDVPPLTTEDAERFGSLTEPTVAAIRDGVAKQERWLTMRAEHRLATPLTYASVDKPLSRRFAPFERIRSKAEAFRARRRPRFLREYPWIEGDPRVFWWRLLDAYGPEGGDVLNVGAMPPDRRDETADFLAPTVRVLEMDIDASRQPHFLSDVAGAPRELDGRFSAVLLFGLPCVDAPSAAVAACRRLTRPGGVGLFGFTAFTHPWRGGLWNPFDRPCWRPQREPLENLGMNGNFWSFDDTNLGELFAPWDQVEVEFISHYWFAVCRNDG